MTPVYKILLANSSNGDVWAKLENQNPTGSHKDRSVERWIMYYTKQNMREFVISSSGNSAISAAKYCSKSKSKLTVFVSPNISKEKMEKLNGYQDVILNITKTPNKDAFVFAKQSNAINLRASKDDASLKGYESIALELIKQIPHIDNIFIPTSSGATLQGMYRGFKSNPPNKLPAFFAIQTAKVNPIASYFDKNFTKEKESRADAIVDNVAHRRDKVIEIIEETNGGGFVISNSELVSAKNTLHGNRRRTNLVGQSRSELGWQSALAFAGFMKWQAQNPEHSNKQTSLCLFTD